LYTLEVQFGCVLCYIGVTEAMSRRTKKEQNEAPRRRQAGEAAPGAPTADTAFKPRRGLLAALLAVFVVWIGGLLYLYGSKVAPQRASGPATTQAL